MENSVHIVLALKSLKLLINLKSAQSMINAGVDTGTSML